MIFIGILGLIVNMIALFAYGILWILFGIIFWGIILAFMLLDLSGNYGVVALYIFSMVLNLFLIYKITRR